MSSAVSSLRERPERVNIVGDFIVVGLCDSERYMIKWITVHLSWQD